jgi:acetyl-CoA carboxylase biotin carboxylase subunit
MIKKILIANRGEIALRIIKACREMAISTVAVYSEVDKAALHVQAADEIASLGPALPAESYLNINKIIKLAKKHKCEAIHPGYGFLAENPQFVQQCEKNEIIFIGPNFTAMHLVADKLHSRNTMIKAGIPIIPGMDSTDGNIKIFKREAEKIGYPVIIKASAGGGGKGMRIVYNAPSLQSAIDASKREAKTAFGNETVYLEKYIEKPRHIEFQVLADNFGNVVHLYERECSIPRRHQKIVEETPSTALDDQLRNKMGKIACKVIKLSGYTNAGTVEFLLDQDNNYYFLEVNARIQVEHPITELVTGVDLVKQQIRIADGEKLNLKQEKIKQRGHAIECRIYAEDPENNFFPSFGKILVVQEPNGPGIRCDSGIYSGLNIPYHYDPILSKLVVWDENREMAIQRMDTALSDYVILGVKTQISFLRDLIKHPEFQSGNLHTHFLLKNFSNWKPRKLKQNLKYALIGAAIHKMIISTNQTKNETIIKSAPWQLMGEWEFLSKKRKNGI